MKLINNIFRKDTNLKKFLTTIIIILLCGNILTVGMVVSGDAGDTSTERQERGARLASFIDINNTTAYTHQNLTFFGTNGTDYVGQSVNAGDINGDSIDDIIIGANSADSSLLGRVSCGAVYVIFGNTSFPSNLSKNMSTEAELTIYGAEQGDSVGFSVASGDVNGDNKIDIVIGAPGVSTLGRTDCGAVYVIFGNGTMPPVIDLNTSTGLPHQDVTIYGQEAWNSLGSDVAVGDVSSDNKNDIVASALYASGPGNGRPSSGEVYIIDGQSFVSPTTIDLNTSTGSGPDVQIYGADPGDLAGMSIAIGDINGNGKEDVIIGVPNGWGPSNGRTLCGEVNVIYGQNTLPGTIDLNPGTPGTHSDVTIYGIDSGMMGGDQAGYAVAAGDVGSDSKDDVIIGAPQGEGPGNARGSCGEVYIVYGSNFVSGTAIDLNVGTGGVGPDVIIYGADSFEQLGYYVYSGRLNNKTKDDIIMGAPYASSGPIKDRMNGGIVYVINGIPLQPATIDTNTTTATPHHNTTIWGALDLDRIGISIAAGDINGDTLEDLIIGAPDADDIYSNKTDCGGVYVLYSPETIAANLNPWIENTDPLNGSINVALDAPIIVNFSEPMNPATVLISFSNPAITFTPNWNTANDGVNYTHTTLFQEKTTYQFQITSGLDLTGKSLIQNPYIITPNPWEFTTGDFTSPMVTLTSPVNASTNVQPEANITITFSEAMNITTVTYTCEPDPGGWIAPPTWDATNTTVTFSHTNLFQESTYYWFNITAGKDLVGLSLGPNPGMPSSINFRTADVTPPKILLTIPANDTTNVANNAILEIFFSESMKISSVNINDDSIVNLDWQPGIWTNSNATLKLTHATDFEVDTWYNISISGTDMADLELVPGTIPNPFRFKTSDAAVTAPDIIQTTPADTATNVLLDADVVVKFSLSMDKVTVLYQCTPAVTGGFTALWNANNDTVTYTHAANFAKSTNYIFEIIAGQDLAGGLDLVAGTIPNPWSFTTVGDIPLIIKTTPANGAKNVLLDAEIIVQFSKVMNATTIQYQCTPTVTGGFTTSWDTAQTEVTFQHATDFTKKTEYNFSITAGKGIDGFDLISGTIPNPFTFETIGDNPIIIKTTPVDGAVGVALDTNVIVEFNKPMQTGTVMYTTQPTLTGGYTALWNAVGDILTLSHVADFESDTVYTFEITAGKDLDANELVEGVIPNMWAFKTVGDEPVIFSTDPEHDEIDVKLNQPLVITFSEDMSITTVTYTIGSSAGDPGGWVPTWSDSDKTLTLTHNDFTADTKYTFEITAGQDLTGNALIIGPVPNPFEFTTGVGKIIPDFTTKLSSPADGANVDTLKPTLNWEATENATKYWVYISTDETQVEHLEPSIRKEVTGTSYTPTTDLVANMTYYWTVIPNDGTNDGTSSGVRSFTTPGEEAVTPTDKEDEEDLMWLWLLIIIVVIVVIILVVVMMKKKKEAPPPEEPAREEVSPAGPEAAPGPEAPVAAPVEAPPTEEKPPVEEISPTPTPSLPTLAKVDSIEPTEKPEEGPKPEVSTDEQPESSDQKPPESEPEPSVEEPASTVPKVKEPTSAPIPKIKPK